MGDKVAVREISLWTHEISSAGVSALLKVSVTSAWDLAQICILASASVFGKLTWNVSPGSLLTSQVMSVARGYVMTEIAMVPSQQAKSVIGTGLHLDSVSCSEFSLPNIGSIIDITQSQLLLLCFRGWNSIRQLKLSQEWSAVIIND